MVICINPDDIMQKLFALKLKNVCFLLILDHSMYSVFPI